MKVVEKNKPIPVEETITIQLTKTELAMLVSDVGATDGTRCAEWHQSIYGQDGTPGVDTDKMMSGHYKLFFNLKEELVKW